MVAGHKATLRPVPKSFGHGLPEHTHDWEVYVKGQGGADISHYIEKVTERSEFVTRRKQVDKTLSAYVPFNQ